MYNLIKAFPHRQGHTACLMFARRRIRCKAGNGRERAFGQFQNLSGGIFINRTGQTVTAAFAALSFVFTREDIRKKDICMWEERSAAAGKSVSLNGISAYFFTGKTSEGLVFSTDVFCTETASDGENGNGG